MSDDFKDNTLTDKELPALLSETAMEAHRRHWTDRAPSSAHNSPGFMPSATQAAMVGKMRTLGMSPREIGMILNIEKSLVEFYYGYELKTASLRTNMSVAQVALKMALSGQDPDMTRFWLKTRAGWKETEVHQHEGLDATADEAKAARQKLLEE